MQGTLRSRVQVMPVRMWGWSGYFCELDKTYQDQIIGRHVYDT